MRFLGGAEVRCSTPTRLDSRRCWRALRNSGGAMETISGCRPRCFGGSPEPAGRLRISTGNEKLPRGCKQSWLRQPILLPVVTGGACPIEDHAPDEILTAEDLSEEHLAIARTGAWINTRN